MNQILTSLVKLKGEAQHILKAQSPALLAAVGVSGALTTAYLTGKASWDAALFIKAYEDRAGYSLDPKQRFKDRSKMVWRMYIPAGLSASITVGSIITGTAIGTRRTAAVGAAYSVIDKGFTEYREKVVEQLGATKEQKIRDEIAQEKIAKNPPSEKNIIVTGSGTVLCCELYTGRYFYSDMEALRKAQNDLNARLISNTYAMLDEFYDMINLPYTTQSRSLGWEANKQMNLEFTSIMSPGNIPCLAFDYSHVVPL